MTTPIETVDGLKHADPIECPGCGDDVLEADDGLLYGLGISDRGAERHTCGLDV